MGLNSFPQQGGGTDFFKMTPMISKINNNTVSVTANSYSSDLITISGKGIINDVSMFTSSTAQTLSIVVDGVTLDLNTDSGTKSSGIWLAGSNESAGTASNQLQSFRGPIPFKSSFAVKVFNCNTTADATARAITVQYLLS